MHRLYFTFGSNPVFPYGREDYIVAVGNDTQDCLRAFQKKYPNQTANTLNCADWYTVTEWKKVTETYYKDKEPKEILISDTVYGCKPEGFGAIWFFVPSQNHLIFLQEGCGDNLLPEDVEEGNVDYLDYMAYDMENGEISEGGGGELLLKQMVQEKYTCLAEAIPDILDFEYDDPYMDAQILKTVIELA